LTSNEYNNIVVDMIPALVALTGAPWDVLPQGIHPATLVEVEQVFATNRPRRVLFDGLVSASTSLLLAGCQRIYLDGSYVSGKPIPGDYDACWDPAGVDRTRLDPVFSDFSNSRYAQKVKFGGEFFPSTMMNTPSQPFVDFFQIDRFTGQKKGILLVNLHSGVPSPKSVH
jgi:hypothetical protein